MTQFPHPPADLRVALRGSCVRNPGLFLLFLHALLATLLGRPQAPAWRSLLAASAAGLPTGNAMDEWDDGYEWDDQDPTTQGYWSPRRHWHADCDPSILYVIGPPPNRGMRVLPRPIPAPRPRTARAPPVRRKRSAGSAASGRTPPGLSAALPIVERLLTRVAAKSPLGELPSLATFLLRYRNKKNYTPPFTSIVAQVM